MQSTHLSVFLLLFFASFGLLSAQTDGPVCGANGKDYPSKEAAHSANTTVINCGNCGACSNRNDINIYNFTRNNLTQFTTRCAYLYTLFGEAASRKCMEALGFTTPCLDCWMDNILCDRQKCLWICIWVTATGQPHNKPDGSLNDCLACDERECGPPFIKCAGANRRTSGISSDIDRDKEQICKIVDPQ
eukprot:TRINITY_DN1393_c0_g1_i1.p1 TRINITY_DN1393_c0_g1~~TRINITY_DN1393_c0_g1_i1.p1  ORF type:complete len:208 (-),score=55.84 TRINITY_DN1393_c0_g1_i1:23-589(-)